MEPERSSPYTQEPTTCPYPEPDQSSLCAPTQPLLIFSIRFAVQNRKYIYILYTLHKQAALLSYAQRDVVSVLDIQCGRFCQETPLGMVLVAQ
jgi:hypothetical protein